MPTVNAREAMHAFDFALGYELMRCTVRVQMKSIPRPVLAKLLGVNTKRLRHFMDGGDPGDKLWMAGAAFAEGMTDPPEVELEAVALNLIADTFPVMQRARVRRALADAIRPVLLAEGREPATL